MSEAVVLDRPSEQECEKSRPTVPDESVLEDKLPEPLRLTGRTAGWCVGLALVFLLFNYLPLWHTDLWGHLAYGRYIWQTGRIPETEPLMPLARGVPFIDTAWLSQVLGYGVVSLAGVEGLKFGFGLAVLLCLVFLLCAFYRRTDRWWLCLAGVAGFLWAEWQQITIVRPQLLGLVFFVLLLALLARRRLTARHSFLTLGLFALWANVHGSFIVGLAVLAAFCVGRAVDVWRRTGRWSAVLRDGRTREYWLLTELAAVAVLVNPYGLGIYAEVLTFARNPNLQDIVEWKPLHLRTAQGQAAACLAVALMFLYRLTPRRIQAAEVLMLLGLGGAALWFSRLITWWVPVAVYCLVLHADAVLNARFGRRGETKPVARGRWSIVAAGAVWVSFALCPLGGRLLHGDALPLERAVSRQTPVRAVEYLRQHPPKGLVFNTYEWGDFLLWAGPKNIQVFLNSHAHLVPQEVWQHYLAISRLDYSWASWLDRYGVNTVVVDKALRRRLIDALESSRRWKKEYEDDVAVIFVRRKPV